MSVVETRRPSRGLATLLWVALGLGVYGILAAVGVGGLDAAVEEVPGTGFVGGLFVGMALLGIPTVAAWLLGRPLEIAPAFPRMARVVVWIGVVGVAVIGLVALLVDIGFLELVIVDAP